MNARLQSIALLAALAASTTACPGTPAPQDATPDSDIVPQDAVDTDTGTDAGPPDTQPASTAHCEFDPALPTARAGGTVTEGEIRAGTAEAPMDLPVGSTLGAYFDRATFRGSLGQVDQRRIEFAGAFHPSVGVETAPMLKALALTVGDETVVFLKADLGVADDTVTSEVTRALGPEFHGKVVVSVSHSHGSFGHYHASPVMSIAFGRLRNRSHTRLVEQLVAVARQALDARVPARLGIAHDGAFDPENQVTRDRRMENDDLPNGRNRKDHDLFVIRVDAMDGTPMAIVPVFGIHGTVLGGDNNIATTDSTGGIERALEESFDRRVLVMHLQGAAGDVSPTGSGGIDCDGQTFCYNFARNESIGRLAIAPILAAYQRAGTSMRERMSAEMVTRSIPLGTDWRTFSVRDGALAYAPPVRNRQPDGVIFTSTGAVSSPIDEFNAPTGAGLCGSVEMRSLLPSAQMPGTYMIPQYQSCMRLGEAATFLGTLLQVPLESGNRAQCTTLRTTVSALRLGDYMLPILPGEPLNLLADHVRARSPMPADHTIVLGYSQGNVGYLLTADDWLRTGYEPSINVWGPLEGEYIAERAAELMTFANTPMREDVGSMGADHWRAPQDAEMIPAPDPATAMEGTVPATVPASVYARNYATLTGAQPPATVRRLESARFVWIGEDPMRATPRVQLQREEPAGSGTFVTVRRRSGRPVIDGDLITTYTPDPLRRDDATPRTHYWVVEWQAVTPRGVAMTDDLEDRPGVALGRYRFHVEGNGYTVNSNAFEVVPGALALTGTRAGNNVNLQVGYEARDGFRLLDMTERSNRRVPLRRGPVTVQLTFTDGMTRDVMVTDVTTAGAITVDTGGDATRVRSVRVTDRFGNTHSIDL